MRSKSGFTLMEIMLASALSAALIFAAIVTPLQLIKQMNGYKRNVEAQHSFQVLLRTLQQDLVDADGHVSYDGEYLLIRTSAYRFAEDGVYREVQGREVKLCNEPLILTVYSNAFSLSTLDTSSNKGISLYFNVAQSSFD